MKNNKYRYVKVLQGNYGTGWNDLLEFGDGVGVKMRKDMLKCYRDNEKRAQHRIIDRRVLNKDED